MRIVVFAALLLASSSLCPSFAQEQGKAPPVAQPQTVPAQPDQNSQQQRDQRTDRDQPRADDREMGRDWRMRRDRDDDRIATRIADDTESGAIETIEAGAARTEIETTGVTMKIGPAVA
jgi:hypothetical protein